MRYAILYGSYREARRGIKAAEFIQEQVDARGHETTMIDACNTKIAMLDLMYREYDEAPEHLETIHQTLEEADGLIIVSGEYNHSIPPGLKNLLDHFQAEYQFKPGGIATYSKGPFGGVRASVHLRAILGELGMVTPSTMFAVSGVDDFDEDVYARRITKFLDELDWYATALKKAREEGVPF